MGLNKFLKVPKENIYFRDATGVDAWTSDSRCLVRLDFGSNTPKCQPNQISGKFESANDRTLFYAYSYNYLGSDGKKSDNATWDSIVAQINSFRQSVVIFETSQGEKDTQYWPISEHTTGITKPCLVMYSCTGFNKGKLGIIGELKQSLNGKFFNDFVSFLHSESCYELRNLTYAKFYEELLKNNSSVKKINFNNFDENQVILTCPAT